jgi:hypothetical protein
MKTNVIATETGKDDTLRVIEHNFTRPENLTEAIEAWGDSLVFQELMKQVIVAKRASVRSLMRLNGEKKLTDAAIAKKVNSTEADWKPKVDTSGDPVEKMMSSTSKAKLSNDQTRELIQRLQAQLEA